MSVNKNRIIRVTVVGDGGIGKTCMLIAYKDGTFNNEEYTPTVFDSYSMTVPINKVDYSVVLVDTAGQEEFEKLRKLGYKNVDCFIVCYSVDSRDSFENVKNLWVPEIKHYCPKAKIILAATKSDSTYVEVYEDEGKRMAQKIQADGFVLNSAKEHINIDETFNKAFLSVAGLKQKKINNTNLCHIL